MRIEFVLLVCLPLATLGQMSPVVSPRGVVNAFTQQPAPTAVAPGGLLWVNGLNLGPPEGFKAASAPWPVQVGEPPLSVLINGRPAAIQSATPQRVVVQVPWELNAGLSQVVVRKGEVQSRPARFFINALVPSVRTQDDKGYGEAALEGSGALITLSGSGFGPAEPRPDIGAAGQKDPPASARATVRVWVGGTQANASAALSSERPGEFDIQIEVPAEAKPGDLITVLANNASANRTTYKRAAAEVKFLAMPEGAGEMRSIGGSDLKGDFVVTNGARGEDGCYAGYVFDFAKASARKLEDCLVAANRAAPTPFTSSVDGAAVGALLGPAEGEAPNGVSAKMLVLNPAMADPMKTELPGAALTVGTAEGGNLSALIPGTPPKQVMVDVKTGEVREMTLPGLLPGAGAGGGVVNLANLTVDLGDGVKHVLSIPVALAQQRIAVVVGDDEDKPAKAKLAVLNQRLELQTSVDFPEGYVPLVPPAPQTPQLPPGGVLPGLPGGGAGGAVVVLRALRVVVNFDAQTRTLYVVSAKADGSAHGLVSFEGDELRAEALPLPAGWYVPACTAQIELFSLELSRRLALLGSQTLENGIRNPCPANGFILVDLAQRQMAAVALPGSGQFGAGTADELNDYVYGFNVDTTRQGRAETLYVLDGVTASAFRMDLPPEITSFGQLQPVRELGALVGLATNRVNGDAGLVYFDLEQASGRLLPTPNGFASVQLAGVFTATRKLVARGTKTGGTGSQYLIYDLMNGDLAFVANPKDVAFVGTAQVAQAQQPGQGGGVPGQPGQPGQPAQQQIPMLQRLNAKAGMVAAVCYNDQREQVGVMWFRVP